MSNRLNKIVDWVSLARQAQWSASAMAKQSGVSVRTLHRHFLRHMGKNTRAWLDEQRQHAARELLSDGSSGKETSAYLGYKQQSSFSRHYKQQTGHCPSKQPPANPVTPNSETTHEGREASKGTRLHLPSRPSRDKMMEQTPNCPQMTNNVRKC